MSKIIVVIIVVGGYVLEYVFINKIFEIMVDINDEWIIICIGIKERCILKEEGKGIFFLVIKVV